MRKTIINFSSTLCFILLIIFSETSFSTINNDKNYSDKILTFNIKDLESPISEKNFSKLHTATKLGIFSLKIPKNIKPELEKSINFGYNFSKNIEITKNSGILNGYQKGENHQIESFYCKNKDWNKFYSKYGLLEIVNKVDKLGAKILNAILTLVKIPETDKALATGGLTNNMGEKYFVFNHFRPQIKADGLCEHKDLGHIAIIFNDKPGLQVLIHNKWVNVPVSKDRFIVIIGATLELVVNNKNLLQAANHRVTNVPEERISFGLFMDSNPKSKVYKYVNNKIMPEEKFENAQQFINSIYEEF